MEPSELLHANKKYKCVAGHYEHTRKKARKSKRNCMTQSSKVDVTAIRLIPGIQLLDYDIDGQPHDETLKTPKRPVEASEGFVKHEDGPDV